MSKFVALVILLALILHVPFYSADELPPSGTYRVTGDTMALYSEPCTNSIQYSDSPVTSGTQIRITLVTYDSCGKEAHADQVYGGVKIGSNNGYICFSEGQLELIEEGGSVTINDGIHEIAETNAILKCIIGKKNNANMTQFGVKVWHFHDKTEYSYQAPVTNPSGASKSFSVDLYDNMQLSLQTGTKYQYQFHTVIDGITYYGDTGSFMTKGASSVAALSIETAPSVTQYLAGDSIATEGIVLNALWSDGTSETIHSGFTVNGDTSKAGRQPVTISYGGGSAVYYIEVSYDADSDGKITVFDAIWFVRNERAVHWEDLLAVILSQTDTE